MPEPDFHRLPNMRPYLLSHHCGTDRMNHTWFVGQPKICAVCQTLQTYPGQLLWVKHIPEHLNSSFLFAN